jgi:O-antigen ligase
MKKHLLALAVTGLTTAGTSVAAPYAPFDVRSAGMGGTGVASAKAASAALFNPAMLSAPGRRRSFSVRAGCRCNRGG